jgi:hypothetical protein
MALTVFIAIVVTPVIQKPEMMVEVDVVRVMRFLLRATRQTLVQQAISVWKVLANY